MALISTILAACGGGGGGSGTQPENPPVVDPKPEEPKPTVNQPPIAVVPEKRIDAILGHTVTLSTEGRHDPDGDQITYKWEIAGLPAMNTATLSDLNSPNPVLLPKAEGQYIIKLVVNDGKQDSYPVFVNIHVTKPDAPNNKPPVAELHSWYFLDAKVGEQVLLNSISKDPDQDLIETRWEMKVPKGSQVTPSNGEYGPTYLVFRPDVEGQYEITLVVTDQWGASDSKTIVMDVVKGNSAPRAKITTSSDFVEVYKYLNLNAGDSTDYDKDPLQFRWSIISQPNGSAPKLSGLNDFNSSFVSSFITDKAGTYVIQLEATDGKSFAKPVQKVIEVVNEGLKLTSSVTGQKLDWNTTFNERKQINYDCAYDRCDHWVTGLGGYELEATDRNYTITDFTCESNYPVQSIYPEQKTNCEYSLHNPFNPQSEITVLRSNTATINFSALADRNREVEYTFKFKIKETGATVTHKAAVSTTYKP